MAKENVVYATAKILIFLQITTITRKEFNGEGCLCYCKDTNFSANHNDIDYSNTLNAVVYATAKILIFLQITTQQCTFLTGMGCLCYCKDTNFSANHNASRLSDVAPDVVYATAKILIFLQITTRCVAMRISACCLCYCKDTNFSANHNSKGGEESRTCVVYATAKILIFLQITTDSLPLAPVLRCLCYCKDTNFSANHNQALNSLYLLIVVYATAKILIFLQITTKVREGCTTAWLFMLLQRY